MLAPEDKTLTQLDIPLINVQASASEHPVLESQQLPEVPISQSEGTDLLSAVVEHFREGLIILDRLDKKLTEIFQPRHHSSEEVTKRFLKLSNGLKRLQLHFDFLLELITAPSEDDFPEIVKKYNALNRHYKPVTKKTDVCLPSINTVFENVVYSLLSEIEKATDKLSITKEDGSIEIKGDRKTIRHAQIMASKLEVTLEYFPEAATLSPDDIFAQARTSETWTNLYKGCEIITLADKATVKKRYKPVYTMFKVANAILYKSEKKPDKKSFKEMCSVVLSGLSYGTKQEKAEFKASLYLSEPRMESAFQVWNFVEKRWLQKLIGFTLPTMDYDKKIYVHRLFPSITKETILKEYETGTLNKITPSTFKPIDLTAKKDLILESLFKKQADAVKMRIISPFPIVLKGINSEKARAMAMKTINKVNSLLTRKKSQDDEPDGIIFHIHGGGFVSGSSSSHRMYLYRWAKRLKKIIISVDYRLAPDYPYPAPLDDVWQAYNWVINYAEPLLGIKTNKIVLAGDSAGGNLCMALTMRAIKMGIRVPDGCLLAYPALNIDPCKYVPSYFLALEDSVLPYSLLKLCTKAYAGEFRTDIDPYLSPVNAEDELLEKLPAIKILTGTDDPLHDDNWRFLQNMQRLNKDIKMLVYEHMPHGFFSFDLIEDYKKVLDGTCKSLAELFGQKESETMTPDQEDIDSAGLKTEAVQTPTEKKPKFSGILDMFKSNQGQSQRATTEQMKEAPEEIRN